MKSSAIRQALLLIVLAFLPAIGEAIYFRDKVPWETRISASEYVKLAQAQGWGESAIWVDARSDDDFQRDHVPGAISLNEDRWNELLPGLLGVWSPEKQIVIYCSSQSCNVSHEVAQRLRNEAGLKNVFILEGGWEEWLKAKK